MNRWSIALRRSAWVALVFSALMLMALGWNAFSSRAIDPNPPTKVDELVTRLNLDPNNKPLLESLRKEDEFLRTSYFRSIRFASIGFFFLMGGLAAFILFSKGAERLSGKQVTPDPNAPIRFNSESVTSQRFVMTMGIGLGGVLALVGTLSRHDAVASYVANQPLPQVRPVAPTAPAGLPVATPVAAGSATTTSAPSVATTPPTGPVALGGTSLAPLPITAPTAPQPTTPPTTKPASSSPPMKMSGWTSFRGAGAGVADAWNGPMDWDVPSGKGVLWKADLALPGWNSPIVVNGKVYLSGADPSHREIDAFDLANGKPLWRTAIAPLAGTAPVKPSPDAGYAPSTLACDGRHVFAAFVDGNVVCLSTEGKPVWGRNFGPLENTYGFASSLLFCDNKLIVQVDQGSSPDQGKSRLYALNPDTGQSIWEVKQPVSASWTSPIALTAKGRLAIAVVANPGVFVYDAANGSEIWHAEGLSGEIAPSACVGDGRIFAGQQGSSLLGISLTDGKVTWNSSDAALPDISSPAFGNGLLFLSSSDGTTTAIDAKDGKIVWEKRLEKPSRSSPIVVGGNVYLTGMDGVVRVFRAARTFSLVAQHRLGEPSQATPAFVNDRIVIRGDHHLYCIGRK